MIPRSLRLSREGFEDSRGLRRVQSAHFSISYGVSADATGGSAIIVPKKAVSGAVARHLLKRRVRAIIRPYSAKGRILIVSAKKGSQELSYAEIENELSPLLRAIIPV